MIVGSESLLDDTEFEVCCKMQFYAAPEKKKKEKEKKIQNLHSPYFHMMKVNKMYFFTPPPLEYESELRYMCLLENKSRGHSVLDVEKRRSFGVGSKNLGSFWCELPKMGVFQCAKMQFQAKIYKFHT